jgi:hypothetical protein
MGYPNWSRDSTHVYFDAALGDPAFYRVRISDRKLDRVAGLEDSRQASGFGGWVGLTPDDSLLLVRDAGTQDINALDWDAP